MSLKWVINGLDNGWSPSHHLNQWRLFTNYTPRNRFQRIKISKLTSSLGQTVLEFIVCNFSVLCSGGMWFNSLLSWAHQAITWTNADLHIASSRVVFVQHMKGIGQIAMQPRNGHYKNFGRTVWSCPLPCKWSATHHPFMGFIWTTYEANMKTSSNGNIFRVTGSKRWGIQWPPVNSPHNA